MLGLTYCGQIRLSRGDTLDLPLEINQGTKLDPIRYELQPNDEVYFALMEPNQPWEFAIIKKKYTDKDFLEGLASLHFEPEDTMCLLPGLYYYQVKVRIYDPSTDRYIVNTIMPKTQFWIEE